MNKNQKRFLHVMIGAGIFTVLALLLPSDLFSLSARLALATISLMVYWWITRPVHIAVTALLPILVNAFFSLSPMTDVLADYFSPIVVLLLGAGMLIACWVASGLDKRIALGALTVIGTSVKKQLVIWFLLSTIMSMFLPNAVVAATLCPIAVAMLRFSASDTEELLKSDVAFLILLAIVWGAGLGGFGTPLGGAMNLVVITHIENVTGQEFMYITWTLKMLPYLAILTAGTCIYLLLIKTKTSRLPGSHTYFAGEYKKMGRMKRTEAVSLLLFLVAVALAFTRPLYASLLPEFKPYYAFLLMGVIGFFVRGGDQKPLISWKFAAQNVNWGLMILFSGGLAAGNMLISSGAADAIAAAVTSLNFGGALPVVLIFVMLGMFLANASSNTAAVSVLIPIVISITAVLALSPLPYIYVAAAACNCAFVLPTSIRAIPTGYGLSIQYMMKKGLAAVAICLVLLSAAGYIGVVFL